MICSDYITTINNNNDSLGMQKIDIPQKNSKHLLNHAPSTEN